MVRYLLVALLISVNFFELLIFEQIFNNKTNLIFGLVWALYGIFKYGNRTKFSIISVRRYYKFTYWIFLSFCLTLVTTYFFWNQSILQSIVTQRSMLWYIYIPLFFIIKPSERHVVKSLVLFSFCHISIWCIEASTIFPVTISVSEMIKEGRSHLSTGYGYLIPGLRFLLLPFYYFVNKLIIKFNTKDLILALSLILFFYLNQNRTILIFSCIIFLLSIFKFRTKYKFIIYLSFIFCGLILSEFLYSKFKIIYEETFINLYNDDYVRFRSAYYYLYDYSPHWLCDIFGNGIISTYTDADLLFFQQENYYNNNDIGWFGFWSYYGIIPLILILKNLFAIIVSSKSPFYLRFISGHMLIPTIWCFWYPDQIIFFALICYIYFLHNNQQQKFINHIFVQ